MLLQSLVLSSYLMAQATPPVSAPATPSEAKAPAEERKSLALKADELREELLHRDDPDFLNLSRFGVQVGSTADSLTLRGTAAQLELAQAYFDKWKNNIVAFRDLERAKLEASTMSLEFPGGTLGEYLDRVCKRFEFSQPVYEREDLRGLRMRPVSFRALDADSALYLPGSLALEAPDGTKAGIRITLVGAEFRQRGMSRSGPGQFSRIDDLRRSVIVISSAPDNVPKGTDLRRAVISLEGYQGTSTPEQITKLLAAVNVAIELDGKSATFKAKYHEPTGLLIVRGTSDELAVVAQVVRAKVPGVDIVLPEFDLQPAPAKPSK